MSKIKNIFHATTNLIISNGLAELRAVEMQIDICEVVQQLLGFPAVLLRVLHLQILTLGPAQLLKVEVEHGCQAVS